MTPPAPRPSPPFPAPPSPRPAPLRWALAGLLAALAALPACLQQARAPGPTPLARQSAGAWTPRASSAFARQEVSYVRAGGRFFLAGGSERHEGYDPLADAWEERAPLPEALDHIQGAAVDGLVYYIGGLRRFPQPHVQSVYVYDPASDTFRRGADMPDGFGRGAGGVTVHDGRIYYAGGLHDGAAVAWFHAYDPASDSWQRLPDMPRVRDHFQAVVLDGKLYAVGGRDSRVSRPFRWVDVYDFAAGEWSTLPTELPTLRSGFAVAVLGDEILVIGGEDRDRAFTTVEAFHPASNTWRALAPMTTPRHGIQAVVCAGSVYLAAGGTAEGIAPTAAHEAFAFGTPAPCRPDSSSDAPGDPPADPAPAPDEPTGGDAPPDFRWRSAAAAPLGRTEALHAVAGGRLLVFGGYTSWRPRCTSSQTHAYDPQRDAWERRADMPLPWSHGGAATDGELVYLAGGYLANPDCSGETAASRELLVYHAGDDAWHRGPELPAARGSGALVRHGRLLHFFGGNDAERVSRGEHWALDLDRPDQGWRSRAPLPDPRSHLSATVLGERIYAVGGQDCYEGCAVTSSAVHAYDPQRDAWERLADLPTPLSHHTALALDGHLVTVAGERAHARPLAAVYAYAPAADAWRSLTPLPAPRQSPAVGLVDGRLLVAGGGDFHRDTFVGERREAAPGDPEPTPEPAPEPDPPSDAEAWRWNAGGDAVALAGTPWAADAHHSPSSVRERPVGIRGTEFDALYRSFRESDAYGGSFAYALPLPDGDYRVTLHFAELYHAASGRRVFDVDVEGVRALHAFDPYAAAGFQQATQRTFTTTVRDGTLDLRFRASRGRPIVNALEATALGEPTGAPADAPPSEPPAPPEDAPAGPALDPLRWNAGGDALSLAGSPWAADAHHSASSVRERPVAVAGTEHDALYRSFRESDAYGGSFAYAVPLPNGDYTVTLHFAELYHAAPGRRVFDVAVEGAPALRDYDIHARAGFQRAVTESFAATVRDGVLDLEFAASRGRPIVNALEVAAAE